MSRIEKLNLLYISILWDTLSYCYYLELPRYLNYPLCLYAFAGISSISVNMIFCQMIWLRWQSFYPTIILESIYIHFQFWFKKMIILVVVVCWDKYGPIWILISSVRQTLSLPYPLFITKLVQTTNLECHKQKYSYTSERLVQE